ncbi:MAG: ABC transporter substrate-binding protein [Erysipelotrichaceae bacterium]|nr:ABC transporter substrate-binding protein [Erysipelotrichaceae bacterium]
MKKNLFVYILVILLLSLSAIIIFRPKNNDNLKKIKVAEVAHSVFYTPQYVAHALGYFKDEGLDVEIILTAGADAVAASVLSGDVNIGFCGSEATIYIYNNGEKDYLVNFAGLTKKDGSFIVSRKKIDNFKLTDLKGKYIIGGRKAGMPEMTLEWILKENGINLKDVTIDTSIAFPAMSGSFIGGTGDFVSLFEPNALKIEEQGYGYVVASLGELGGEVPYTVYNARKSYIENNMDVITSFSNAIQKGLDFTHSHSAEEIAKIILDYFPDTSLDDLTKLVDRYKKIDSWYKTIHIDENSYNHVLEIIDAAGELKGIAPYDKLIKNVK